MATLTTSYQLIASKYIGTTTASTTKNLYLRIYAKYTSQSVAENKSYVSYKSTLYVEGGGTYFYTGNYTTKTLSGTGATSVSADAQGNYYIGETTLSEISGVVSHGSEGTASVSITAGWVSTPWEINGSLTGTASLPTIARATTPTLSTTSTTMGWNVTITLKPANSTFKHKLRYDFGGSTGNADGMSVGWDFTPAGNTTVTFTPPTSLSKQIPTADSANCSIICYTYLSNGTHVGTKTVNLTVSVPVYSPTIKSVTLTGSNLLSGAYVQGKSKVSGAVEAGTSYNAYIKSISSTVDGKTYTGSPFTSGVLSNGSKTVETTVTDSRGKTAIFITPSFTVYGYSAPTITNFTLERQGDGSTVIATVKGSVSAVNNKNAKNITVTLNGVTQTITSSSYTINGTTTFTNVPTDSTFTSTAKIADSYTNVTKDAVLPTVEVTMDFHNSGKGIAFGKVAETPDLFEVAWDVKAKKNLDVEKNANIAGDLAVDGDFTLGGMNLLNHAKSQYGWGKNTFIYNSQTVANSSGNTINGASINLEANSTYLVLVGIMSSDGSQTSYSDILLAQVETGGEVLISCSGRGGAYAGGGICGFAIVKTTSSTFARCQSHGYKNASFNLYMRTVAIKLDT